MEIVKIDAKEYGVQESKAQEIQAMFSPMLDKMAELEKQYNDIMSLEDTPESCKKAKELRLQYVSVRTETSDIHKSLKEFYLLGGRFVDGWKNAQKMASKGLEEKLLEKETYFERKISEEAEKIHEERKKELSEFQFDDIPLNLGQMSDGVYRALKLGAKAAFAIKKDAEEKAEKERLESERKKGLKAARWQSAREYISYFAPAHFDLDLGEVSSEEWKVVIATAKANKAKAEKEKEKLKAANEKLRKEKEAAQIKAKRNAAENKFAADAKLKRDKDAKAKLELKLKKEKDAKAKLGIELKKRKEAEALAKKEEEERIQAELAKGDLDKLSDLRHDIEKLQDPETYQFEASKFILIHEELAANLRMSKIKVGRAIQEMNKAR